MAREGGREEQATILHPPTLHLNFITSFRTLLLWYTWMLQKSMSTSRRGAFIVIEGLDRSGKSTQAAALLARLEHMNVPAKLIKFPGQLTYTPELSRR